MHIESVTLSNFRCFGAEPTTVTLGPEVTALIGCNGSGKSAFVEALRRLFGLTREERTLSRADVHFAPDESPDAIEERQVVIDVVFAFPELSADADAAATTVPEVFKVMTAGGPGEPLKARLRLEALWHRGESFIDDIETNVYWISHLDDVEFGEEDGASLDKERAQATDRAKVQLIYVPATRDGGAVTRQALRQLLRRLERSGDFGTDNEDEVRKVSDQLQEKMSGLPAIDWVTKKLCENWDKLHGEAHLRNARLVVISQEFTQLLRNLTAKLSPAPDGRERSLEELSEGQTSLFFLALASTLAQLESELSKGEPPDGFTDMDVAAPALTIYAVEEPENHLSPFYMSRLMGLLRELCAGEKAMGLVTSHSPAIVRRLEPEDVRHFRLDRETLITHVNAIRLPARDEEAEKFVREAVHAQPEIYFARLVILGEGDSEQLILPRIARALGVDLDPAFVAIAPLGGRHVNHFWRLLADLNIPHITLLDFDLGRHGAGRLRLKYAYNQLQRVANAPAIVPAGADPKLTKFWKSRSAIGITRWLERLAKRNVYFSYPLDLDMMMLRAYPDVYGVDNAVVPADMDKSLAAVFGEGKGVDEYENTVSDAEKLSDEEIVTYNNLFKKRSKPASHLSALAKLTDKEIADHCPGPLRNIIESAQKKLGYGEKEDGA